MIDQHNSLAEKFLKKGFWLYLFSFIIAPMGYIIKIIVSGELTVSEVGILYGIISLITMISAYNDLGMTESLKHFIPQYIQEKRYDKVKSILFVAFVSQIITSFFIMGLFFFGAEFIAQNYFRTIAAKETLQVFAFFFIGLNIFQTLNQFFLAIQNTFLHKITELLRMGAVMFSVLFIFVFLEGNLLQYSYSWLIGLYVGLIFILFCFYRQYYKKYLQGVGYYYNIESFIKISKYALMVLAGIGAGTILGQIDMQMIIYILGTQDAGYYTNYLSIIGIPFMVITPIFAFLFPVISELHAQKNQEKIQLIKNMLSKVFIIIGISISILFFSFGESLATMFFGEKFITSGIILQYSIFFLVFNFLLQINFNILAGIGKVKERIKIVTIAMIFNIITNLILIKLIGVSGAALATGLGWGLIWILSERKLSCNFQSSFPVKTITKNAFLLGLIGILMLVIIKPMLIDLSRPALLLYLSIVSIIYYCVFVLINYSEAKVIYLEIKKLKKGN